MQNAFRKCLEAGDADGLARLWRRAYPHLRQPKTAAERRVVLHRARSEAASLSLAKRLYSHAWLTERGLPSGLPRELRPKGERDRPMIVSAVGVAVWARRPDRREEAKALEKAMADAAADCYAEGITDPARVSARMWEAREAFRAHA